MRNKKPPLPFALLFVGFWSLLTLIFDGMLVFNAYRQFQANSYPVATGTMTHSEVSVHHGDDSTTYGVEVKYEYQVDGRRYEGDRYRYGQWNSSDDSAQKIVDSLPVGKQVDVRYNPADPGDSVLAVGIQSGDLFLTLFLTPFNLVMLGGWYTVLAILFPGISGRMARPPRVISRGFTRRLVLAPAPRLLPAAVVLGISSFLSIFVIGFGFGFSPPMAVIQVVWGIVLGLAGATLMRRPAFSLHGKGLVIDDVENTFSIVANDQKQSKEAVSLQTVLDVESARKGEAYKVVLIYSNEELAECRETLIEVSDPRRAAELAGWVKDQVLVAAPSTSRRRHTC